MKAAQSISTLPHLLTAMCVMEGRIALVVKMLLDAATGCIHFLIFLLCFLLAFACASVAPFSSLSPWFKDIPTAIRTWFALSVGQVRCFLNSGGNH